MEEKKFKIVLISGIGLFVFIIILSFILVGGGEEENSFSESAFDDGGSEYTLEDMKESSDKYDLDSDIPFSKETNAFDNLISDSDKTKDSTEKNGFYDNEESKLIAELQKEYEKPVEIKKQSNGYYHRPEPTERIVYVDRPVKEEPKKVIKSDDIELDDFEFTISDDSDSDNSGTLRNDIPAVIDENYKGAKENQIIRIRTIKDCIISGAFIPENTIIEGVTRFGDRRVFIDIDGIDLGNSFVTCSMEVRDRLKRKGLESKKNLSKELAKDGSEEIADKGNTKINTPIGSFGVDAFKKKNNEQSINLYENHKLYLRLKTR